MRLVSEFGEHDTSLMTVYLLMLPVCEKLALLTGNTAWARVPSNSIGGAVSCLINTLADGAEGLHFSAI